MKMNPVDYGWFCILAETLTKQNNLWILNVLALSFYIFLIFILQQNLFSLISSTPLFCFYISYTDVLLPKFTATAAEHSFLFPPRSIRTLSWKNKTLLKSLTTSAYWPGST